jgi:hypothetical protein
MNAIIGLIIRHGLTSVGGALVAKGAVTASEWETAAGALAALVGVALSAWRKYKRGEFRL